MPEHKLVINWIEKIDHGDSRSEDPYGYGGPVIVPGITTASVLNDLETAVFEILISDMTSRCDQSYNSKFGYLVVREPYIVMRKLENIRLLAKRLEIECEILIENGIPPTR